MFFFGTTFLPHIVVWLGDIGFFEEQPKKALICYNTCTDLLELVRNNQTLVLLGLLVLLSSSPRRQMFPSDEGRVFLENVKKFVRF